MSEKLIGGWLRTGEENYEIDLDSQVTELFRVNPDRSFTVAEIVEGLAGQGVAAMHGRNLEDDVPTVLGELRRADHVRSVRSAVGRLYYWVSPMEALAARKRRARVRAGVLVALVVATVLVLIASVANASVWSQGEPVASPVVPVAQADGGTVAHKRCAEDDPCFNPCTMGVNGEYPATDPRYYVPGPCNITTPLPNGAVFQVAVEPVEPVGGVVCASGQFFAQVTVMGVGQDNAGDVRSEAYGSGCARYGDPLASFVAVLPGLYLDAARQLDA